MLLGVHVPTAGGLDRARGRDITADANQIVTRNQVQWRARPLAREVRAFRVAVAQSGLRLVLPHGLGATFRRLLNDLRFRGVPMVLETPGPLPVWKRELRLLRGLVGRGRGGA